LAPGMRLRSVGLRADCASGRPADDRPDGVLALPPSRGLPTFSYELTGVIGRPTDVRASGVGGAQYQVGAEFQLTAGDQAFVVLVPGTARDYGAGDQLTVRGTVWVIPAHEWDAFELPDLRRDWRVNGVKAEHRSLVPKGDGGSVPGEVRAVFDLDRMRRWEDQPGSRLMVSYVVDLSLVLTT